MNTCNNCENNNHSECVQMVNGPKNPCPCHESECLSSRREAGKLARASAKESHMALNRLALGNDERLLNNLLKAGH